MRTLLRTLKPYAMGMRRDRHTGHLWYPVEGIRLHIRRPHETMREVYRRRAFDACFGGYRPRGNDVVVDFGAGLGTEIARLARIEPGLRYIAVEIQPWVYECLSLTFAQLPPGYRPFGLAVGQGDEARIDPTADSEEATCLGGGAVSVPMIGWDEFVRRHGLVRIDLLKMNIEGGEAELLDHANLDMVERVIVQVHDFRADRGEGEHFRTRARVEARLSGAGFALADRGANWIYGARTAA